MMLHGWCMKCHKIKRVRVRFVGTRQTPVGVCAACEEAGRGQANPR